VVVSDGALQLLDLDRIAHGPREWDLIQPLAAASRFRDVGVDVEQFLSGYDWDVRLLAGHEILVKLRLLFMTSWLLTLPRTPVVQQEIRIRMSFWRTSDGAPRWSPV
jgi:hypothetical protein